MARGNVAVHGPDPVDVKVGARIRAQRRRLGLSQSALANAIGITFQQVQKYERGANRVSASMLVRTAAKLATTVAALVGEEDTEQAHPPVNLHLQTPGAADLLARFAAIPGAQRRALLAIAESLAISQGGQLLRPKPASET
jgi:transcriptional regulator with XRE-family HTH domain